MAKMIPHKAYHTGSEGEERVFEALQTLLPNSYTILHSYRWIGSGYDRQSQGEADFVVFHPKKGILVIEVKAGLISLEHRDWYQENRNTGEKKEIRDPEEQAAASKYRIIKFLHGIRNCLVCHTVWFPSVGFNSASLPPNYSPEMLLDEASLDDPQSALDNAYNFWASKTGIRTNLSTKEIEVVIKRLIPSMHLVPSPELDFEKKQKQFMALTQEQCKIINILQMQNRATIAGVAGTGKTIIAIEKARQLQDSGGTTLFLCFNHLLAEHLNNTYSHYGFKISTFDSLARALVGPMEGSFEEIRTSFLEYLIDENTDFKYDNIIVDEGQDFESDWLEYLEFRVPKNGTFYVFYDPEQSLYEEDLSDWLKNSVCRLTLTTNCRNTEAIATTAYGSLGRRMAEMPLLSGIEGDRPTLLPVSNLKNCAKIVDKEVIKFCRNTKSSPDRVAIISMAGWNYSKLKPLSESLNIPFTKNGIRSNHATLTTARKFKGLEADLVIITDHDWHRMEDVTYRRLFYTSASRAKHKLFIFSKNIDRIDVDEVLSHIAPGSKRKGKRKFLKTFNIKEYEAV